MLQEKREKGVLETSTASSCLVVSAPDGCLVITAMACKSVVTLKHKKFTAIVTAMSLSIGQKCIEN